MVFFHFGRSKSARGDDYFVYLGHKPKACLSDGLIARLPARQVKTINDGRARWFAFNQDYDWFNAFEPPGGYLGASTAVWRGMSRRIDDFLEDAKRSHVGPQAVFGADGSVLCWTTRSDGRMGQPRTAARWSADQRARMEKILLNSFTGFADVAIQFGALGYRGAYFIKLDDDFGSVKCDLRGYYPSLRDYLDRLGRRNVQFLALHPQDPEQWFLVDTHGNIRASLSPQIEKQLRSTLQSEQAYTRNMKVVIEVIQETRPLKTHKSESMLVVREVEIDRLSIG